VKINKQIKNDDVLIRALLSYHNDKMYDEIAELLVLNPINSFDDKYQNDLIALVFSIANEHLKSCSTEKLQDLFQVLPEGISAKQIKLRQDDLLKITDEISRYGDIKKAIAILESIPREKTTKECLRRLSIYYRATKQLTDSLNAIEMALEKIQNNPTKSDVYEYNLLKAFTFLQMNNFSSAHIYCDIALNIGRCMDAVALKGLIYSMENKHIDAIEQFKELLEITDDKVEALMLLGQEYRYINECEEALKSYKNAQNILEQSRSNIDNELIRVLKEKCEIISLAIIDKKSCRTITKNMDDIDYTFPERTTKFDC
jgi:tetratricopeptide (TPR) repeat protein